MSVLFSSVCKVFPVSLPCQISICINTLYAGTCVGEIRAKITDESLNRWFPVASMCSLTATNKPHLQFVSSVRKSCGSCPSRHLAQSC